MSATDTTAVPYGANAATLASHLYEAVEAEKALRAQEASLQAQRGQALIGGTDAEIDRLDGELVAVARQLDRHAAVIPELQRLHHERIAVERGDALKAAFARTSNARLSAARDVDTALATLGSTFEAYENAGRDLEAVVKLVEPSARVQGSTFQDALRSAVTVRAEDFATAIGMTVPLFNQRLPIVAQDELLINHFRRIVSGGNT